MCLGICGDLLLRRVNSVVAGLTKISTSVTWVGAILFVSGRPPQDQDSLLEGRAGRCGKVPFLSYTSLGRSSEEVIWLTQPLQTSQCAQGGEKMHIYSRFSLLLPLKPGSTEVTLFIIPSFCIS